MPAPAHHLHESDDSMMSNTLLTVRDFSVVYDVDPRRDVTALARPHAVVLQGVQA